MSPSPLAAARPQALSAAAWPTATTAYVDGRALLAFSGCNYLGLSHHPRVREALERAVQRFGIAANGSRETTGTTELHEALEERLARFLRRERALLTPDGSLANVAICQALAGRVAHALLDERAHGSLRSAAAASGIPVVEFAHRDADAFARRCDVSPPGAPLVLTDGVFAAAGTCAPIERYLTALPERGWLLLDDCHAFGVLGERGRGTLDERGIDDGRVLVTTSLAKALGCMGGAVAGSASLVDEMRRVSSAYRGTTPIPAALAAAALAALDVIESDEHPTARLRENVRVVRACFGELGLTLPDAHVPIFSFALPDEQIVRLQRAAEQAGLLLPLIDYPGGPASRYFRLAVSAAHTSSDLERLTDTLRLALAS